MASRGELLDLLEARERANNDLKDQDARIMAAQAQLEGLVQDREVMWGTWRLVNNDLGLMAKDVFPAPLGTVQSMLADAEALVAERLEGRRTE